MRSSCAQPLLPVCSPHDVLVVFHHHHGVADVTQLTQYPDELFGVTRVQPYRRLVQDIQRAHKTAAERLGECDTLTLAT